MNTKYTPFLLKPNRPQALRTKIAHNVTHFYLKKVPNNFIFVIIEQKHHITIVILLLSDFSNLN